MKAIVCELCGSNELIKTDGVFVCQHCGTKYSLEEAKKLLVEISGPVTVKVEQTPVSEYITKTRQALRAGMMDAAKKYITDAFNADPMNWQVTILRALIMGGILRDQIENAFRIPQKQGDDYAAREFVSLWNDIKICREGPNIEWIWEVFASVFPDQKSTILKYAVPIWTSNFDNWMRKYIGPGNYNDEFKENLNYFQKEYDRIRKYDPNYSNSIFEKMKNNSKSFFQKMFG